MTPSFRASLSFASILALLLLPAVADPAAASGEDAKNAPARAHVLVVGRITGNIRKQLPRSEKFARYLASKMQDLGIAEGRAVVVPDRAAMAELLRHGKVDLYSETVFSSLWLEKSRLSEPFMQEWKNGVAKYHSVLVVRRGSGLRGLGDLRGKTVAFEDRSSTSGFLLPYAMIKRAGLDLVELRSPRDTPPPDKVGYVFSAGEINGAVWVQRKMVAATALSNIDWLDVARAPGPIKNELEILYSGRSVLRSITNVRVGLDPKIRARLKDILMAAKNDAEALKLSKSYNKVYAFEALDSESLQELDEARNLMRRMGPIGY